MKKLIPLLLIAMMVVILGSCGGNKEPIVLHDPEDSTPDVTEEAAEPEASDIDSDDSHTETVPEQNDDVLMTEEFTMPEPFAVYDGDANMGFYVTVNEKLGYLDMAFIEMVNHDEYQAWIDDTASVYGRYAAVDENANLYSFIEHFNIPDETVRELLVNMRIGYDSDFTDEEIDLLLSGDAEAIAEYFAWEQAIRKGKNIFSLNWIYLHPISDYEVYGITAEDIATIMQYFYDYGLQPLAIEAIENKLNIYIAEYDKQMPPPFGYSDGDMNVGFWEPCNMMFGGVPGSLMSLRTGVGEWIDSFPKISSYAPSDIFEYPTMYSFIAHFNITNEEAKEALESYIDDGAMSSEQFEMICSGDVEQMTREFASEYSIVIGEKIYCPHWLYIHSFEEYKSAGITADMILEKAPLFSYFTFTDEARVAFSEKLSEYTGEAIVIEPR